MQLFYLDKDPELCAQFHCDTHVIKQILETAQLLSTAHRVHDGEDKADRLGLYRATHIAHPTNVWVRSNSNIYLWTYDFFVLLCDEYSYRFNKVHKSEKLTSKLCEPPSNISDEGGFTDPPQAISILECKGDNAVVAYREFYKKKREMWKTRTDKRRIKMKWTYRSVPGWC